MTYNLDFNLDDLFRATARRQPEHPAIIGPGESDRLSYRELDEAIGAAAERLAAAGVRPGTCVGLHVPSGTEYIILNYAVWRCGGCVVPIPAELTVPEQQEIFREIALEFAVTHRELPAHLEPFRDGNERRLGSRYVAVAVCPLREHPADFLRINSAFLRFTSGTTGTSKGVVLSHETIRERIEAANEALAIGPSDRVVWLLSMSYHFAVSIVSYLTFGATIILPAECFGDAVLQSTHRHCGTLIYGSPLHYALLADCKGDASLPGLRLALSTALALEPATAHRFERRFAVPVSQALGVIEIGLPAINLDFAADRPEGVGRVLPAYRLRLEDVGLGPDMQEVLLSGPGFLDAYYEPWRTRREIMPGGWFRTGDIGMLDADGCLFLRGRSKEVINTMGLKFFPQEVETVLRAHPRVREACVLARPDPRFGEIPFARVVLDGGPNGSVAERELLEYCRNRLASFKIPRKIEFAETLERTGSGKLLRREVGPHRAHVEPQLS